MSRPGIHHPGEESGQSSMEYLIVCAALALALGIGMSDNNSVLQQLIEAFRLAYARIAFAYSLP
ncbi:MAG TPA: hypothetical protein PKC60_00740 [Hydrogenophaga sp.]|uniref:hypothetical protein n=1 Tax=Hydrogenophaga sp. TaxID=1904254 RepID=UPI002C1CE51F|nr:hypothetical protein [Hydrogenophaga sp.]HMN91730.1 hypothetical protein [Hydrogenophaga sp.]HMP10553.1 hypothetical protein [Hydrogenophaga sp.]